MKEKYFIRIFFTLFLLFGFVKKEGSLSLPHKWSKDAPFELGINKGRLDNIEINEASGLVASRNNPNALWTHNDSGDAARIFLIDENAKHLATFYLANANNRDWEDIAIGTENGINYLYVGDIGDNLASSELKIVYKMIEPAIQNRSLPVLDTLKEIERITFRYPDGNKDAECMMIDPVTNDLIIITKREDNVHIYLAPYPQSTKETITLKKIGTLPFKGIVAGDISADGKEILMKTYKQVYYWKKEGNESIVELLQKSFQNLPYHAENQGEAIAWKTDGRGYFTLSESVRKAPVDLLFYKRK